MLKEDCTILPSNQIDPSKWDQCIARSAYSLIYGTYDYLSSCADNWSGLVINEYEMVLPIPWRKKWGIRYAYHVPFIQQLGLFSRSVNPESSMYAKKIASFCRYGDYSFNHNNIISKGVQKNNYILSLQSNYIDLSGHFSKDAKQNILKAIRSEATYDTPSLKDAFWLYANLNHKKSPHISREELERYYFFCEKLVTRGNLITRSVVNANKQILSSIILLSYNGRLTNIMNATTEEGRNLESNYLLFSSIIKEFQSSGMILDFEGSDIAGIADFYKKWGAVNQPYSHIQIGCLSKIVGKLKNI